MNDNQQNNNQNNEQNNNGNTNTTIKEESKEFFDEYLKVFLPLGSASNFLRNINKFSIFYICIKISLSHITFGT